MKKIIVSISKLGVPTIEAEGFADGSCKHATKPFIDAFTKPGETPVSIDKAEAAIPATGSTIGVGGWQP